MDKVIMAIGGHVGDAELTTGGLLATLSLQGYRIVTVAMTGGEKGNPPSISVEEYRKQKEREAKEFAEFLGGEAIVFPYKDGELSDNDIVRFELCDLIRQYRPKAVLTHWKNSMHKDHELTHKIVKDAQFYAALPAFERELPPHFANGPYYAQNWEDSVGFTPYTYMEVTKEGFELWQNAIQTSWFALHSSSFHYAEYYAGIMRTNGLLIRKEYAEAFDIEEIQKRMIITVDKWI